MRKVHMILRVVIVIVIVCDPGCVQEAYGKLSYLLDVHVFQPESLELNSTVFLWPQNILSVFELNNEVNIISHLSLLWHEGAWPYGETHISPITFTFTITFRGI